MLRQHGHMSPRSGRLGLGARTGTLPSSLEVVLASPQPKWTERRTISRIWGRTLGTRVQSFIGGISVARKDGELSPGERAGKLGCLQKGEKAQAGAKEEEDAGTQCLVYHKHINAR